MGSGTQLFKQKLLNKGKIERFAFNYGRPFTAEAASDLCDVSIKKTQLFIKELKEEGKIEFQRKVGQKHYYIWINKTTVKVNQHDIFQIQFCEETAKKVLAEVNRTGYTTLRDIAKGCGFSHELVRQVLMAKGIEMVNEDVEYQRARKRIDIELLKVLRIGKKVKKVESQSTFLEVIREQTRKDNRKQA